MNNNVTNLADFKEQMAAENNVIRIAARPKELTNVGTEYLTLDGVIVARFVNGKIVKTFPRKS